MKTKLITTDKARLLVVGGLPGNAFNIAIWPRNEEGTIHDLRYQAPAKRLVRIDIPKGNWKLLGKLHEISEDEWKGIVNWRISDDLGLLSKNYLDDHLLFRTASESGMSLVEANVKLEVQFQYWLKNQGYYRDRCGVWMKGENIISGKKLSDKLNEWRKDQESIFTNPVIFIEH